MSDEDDATRASEPSRPPVDTPRWLAVGGAWGWRFLVLALSLYVLLWVGSHLRMAVLPVVLGILLATLLEPLARGMRRIHLPRALAGALSVLLGLGVLAGLVALFVFGLAGELTQFSQTLEKGYRQLVEWAATMAGVSQGAVRTWVDGHLQELQSYAGSIAERVISSVVTLFQTLAIILVMLVFTWFFTWDGDEQFEGAVRILPERYRDHARELGRRVWQTVGAYMRGMFVIATADALLLGLGLWILDVPLVLPLMLLTFLGAFVPFVGPILAGGVAALIGLAHGGLLTAGLVAVAAVVVQQIEGNLLHPFVMGRAVELHPSLILFSVTAGGVLAGVAGVFLAVPVAASLSTVLSYAREQGAI